MGDEAKGLYREANVLYWAIALLGLAYDYIDQCIDEAEYPPPFSIPYLRFVEAGLLFAYSADKSKSGTITTTYLAEETIHGKFFKYIHNGSASPRRLFNIKANEIAQFLSFTQHVQYSKTSGQAYISDYQGSTTLLTDPQILTYSTFSFENLLTSCSVGIDVREGSNLFGDGNVEKGVELFEEQHSCRINRYCQWPGFKLQPFE